MTMFFTAEDVTDYAGALKSDRDRYAAYFRGMLSRGVFLAPSQFEAMFVSLAHTDDDVIATGEAAEASLGALS
jgi:glutamate-1-semialdehyde 2,1-aminomutase